MAALTRMCAKDDALIHDWSQVTWEVALCGLCQTLVL